MSTHARELRRPTAELSKAVPTVMPTGCAECKANRDICQEATDVRRIGLRRVLSAEFLIWATFTYFLVIGIIGLVAR